MMITRADVPVRLSLLASALSNNDSAGTYYIYCPIRNKSGKFAPVTRASDLDSLLEAATEQGGYVTAAQANRLGVDNLALHRMTQVGDLRRVRQGVYALRHARHRLEDVISAWLAVDRRRLPWERNTEPVAVLSHATAASLHNLGTIIPQRPALTVSPRSRSTSSARGIELHVARLADRDWMWLSVDNGLRLPTTTPARTIVDLVLAGEEPSYITRTINEALADDRLSPDELIAAAARRKQRSATLTRRVKALLPHAVS